MTKNDHSDHGNQSPVYNSAPPASSRQLLQQGIGLHQAGDLRGAEQIYRQILQAEPENSDALHLLGVLATQSDHGEAAVSLIRQAIAIFNENPIYWSNLGNALKQQGALEEAVDAYQGAVARDPAFAEAYTNLGVVLQELGRLDESEAALRRALEINPALIHALSNLGSTLQIDGRPEEALVFLERAVELQPNFVEAHNNMGNALKDLERFDEAEAAYRRALDLNPGLTRIIQNLGHTLQEQGKFDEALAVFDRAIGGDPNYRLAHCARGTVLHELGNYAESDSAFQRAIEIDPDYAEAHFSRSFPLLTLERYAEGWEEYEWRWKISSLIGLKRDFPQPAWDGAPMEGKTLFVYNEQGWGDILNFLRYVPLARERVGSVIVECKSPIRALAETVEGIGGTVREGDPLPDFDAHVSISSLPRIFATTTQTIPAQTPYLWTPEGSVSPVEPGPGPAVGLVWAGKPTPKANLKRTMPFKYMERVAAIGGCRFFSLQIGPRGADLSAFPWAADITDLAGKIGDFSDTAAAIGGLDLVISVDTATAHLAGALGKPVWSLLPFVADWRWLLDREDSPWYPTMRLFRQTAIGDWAGVVDRVAPALEEFARQQRAKWK